MSNFSLSVSMITRNFESYDYLSETYHVNNRRRIRKTNFVDLTISPYKIILQTDLDGEECFICMEPFLKGEELVLFHGNPEDLSQKNHKMHASHFENLLNNLSCPVCRGPVSEFLDLTE